MLVQGRGFFGSPHQNWSRKLGGYRAQATSQNELHGLTQYKSDFENKKLLRSFCKFL